MKTCNITCRSSVKIEYLTYALMPLRFAGVILAVGLHCIASVTINFEVGVYV